MNNKMATMPVNKLMIKMGLPIIILMMLQALYNIVDSAFVSNMEGGEAAINALTLAFPVQMLMVAIGIGTGVGVNVLLARSLGEGDKEKASKAAGNGVFLGMVITAVFMLFGLFGTDAYIGSQTSDSTIREMAVSYLRICCVCSVGIVFFSVFEKVLQAAGLTVQSTLAQISGAVINIILDPIMIYGLLGCPKIGVQGAALATVIGQIASFLIALFFHIKKNKSIKNGLRYIRPDKTTIKLIYKIGLPAIIAQALMSVMTYGINLILGAVDASLVTAYGLYYKIQQFILFAAFGLSGGTQAICVSATRIISAGFFFAGISLSLQGVFQALGRGLSSLIISLLRQLVLILPVAWALSQLITPDLSNAWLVWLTFPFAEIITAIIACILLKGSYKNGSKHK